MTPTTFRSMMRWSTTPVAISQMHKRRYPTYPAHIKDSVYP